MAENTQEETLNYVLSMAESAVGHRITTTTDFYDLCKDIEHRTGKIIGISTLKRIWGYVNDVHTPRLSTLNILAEYVGYKDWGALCERNSEGAAPESNFIKVKTLQVESLEKGSMLNLSWLPNRKCVVLYKNDYTFEVIRSELTRLVPKTTFTCRTIYAGESLILENVRIGGDGVPGTYQIGKINGVQFDIM